METEKFNVDAESYEKFDCDLGYVTGEHDILQMKVKRFKEEVLCGLIGTFDDKGKYTIPDEVLVELVNLIKKIDAQTVNGTEARAFVGDKVLHFNMTPPKALENGDAYCYLELKEEVSHLNGYYIDTLTTIIATYEYKFDQFFLNNAYNVFNLKEYKADDPDATAPQLVPDYLGQRYAVLDAMKNQYGDALDKLEEIYFNKRLQLLSEHLEVALILTEFANKRNKLEPYFAKSEHKYYFLNQLLDEVLETEQCKKYLNQSNVKYLLNEADMKYFKFNIQAKEKINDSHQVKNAQKNALFVNIGKSPDAKPAPNKVKPNVKVNSGNAKRSKGGSGKPKGKPFKKDSQKKEEQKAPTYGSGNVKPDSSFNVVRRVAGEAIKTSAQNSKNRNSEQTAQKTKNLNEQHIR